MLRYHFSKTLPQREGLENLESAKIHLLQWSLSKRKLMWYHTICVFLRITVGSIKSTNGFLLKFTKTKNHCHFWPLFGRSVGGVVGSHLILHRGSCRWCASLPKLCLRTWWQLSFKDTKCRDFCWMAINAISYRQFTLNEGILSLLDMTCSRYLILLCLRSLCVMSCSRYCAIFVIFWVITVFQHANICVHASKYHVHHMTSIGFAEIKAW